MLGKTALLYTDDRAAARTLAGHLRSTGTEVVVADAATAACDLIGAHVVELVLVDAAAPDAIEVVTCAQRGDHAVVLLTRGEPEVMFALVCDQEVDHVLARAGDDDASLGELAREVVITAEKILRGDLFGIEKYLPSFGVDVSTAEVRGAGDRDVVVETIAAHAEWLGAGREARRAVAAIVDELVTNAVYDAPRDADGGARYAAVDRRTKVDLDPSEYVTVQWGSDGDLLVISVRDCFGALERAHVRGGLRRCLTAADPIEQKAGGAGLGLYTALAYSSQLVVNVAHGVRTEIIAIVDLRRRGGARRAGRSLHLFHDDAAVCAIPTGDVSGTIKLSETMRIDLRAQLAHVRRRPDVVPLLRPKRAVTTRARGSVSPPLGEPIGADTARGLLRGAAALDTAIQVALRFLTHHYEAAVAYAIDDARIEARFASGKLRDWARLREVRLGLDESASVAALAGKGCVIQFRPSCPMDHRLAMLAVGQTDVDGVVVPLSIGGELRWVLYGVRTRVDQPPVAAVIDQVRRELERCLGRLDPAEPMIEVRRI